MKQLEVLEELDKVKEFVTKNAWMDDYGDYLLNADDFLSFIEDKIKELLNC
jgi:hypothetical protein